MRDLSLRAALHTSEPRRTREHKHKPGSYVLTADFKDPHINRHTINLVGVLGNHFTQRAIARMMFTSVATVAKMQRVYHASLANAQPRKLRKVRS